MSTLVDFYVGLLCGSSALIGRESAARPFAQFAFLWGYTLS